MRPAGRAVRVGGDVGHRQSPGRRRRAAASNAASTSSTGRGADPRGHAVVELVAVLDPAGEDVEAGVVADADAASITRAATDSADVLIATHRPSAQR